MCKAILSGDILGKEFKFEIPFELSGRQTAEDVSVIHQLAAKVMIQEWQNDGEPYEERHKKEIIELSCDASVVSKYTAYIAVDEAQNKPVSGSMQSYELTADTSSGLLMCLCDEDFDVEYDLDVVVHKEGLPLDVLSSIAPRKWIREDFSSNDDDDDNLVLYTEKISSDSPPIAPRKRSIASPRLPSSKFVAFSAPPSSDTSFIVGLQQFDGSWLLNDKLAGVVSKSVEELKSCCPVSCDVTMMANIWATLVVIELLKKKYPSMLDELELVIMKAEQWVGKQVLPSGVDLVILRDSARKII
ncbi:von Willebrand factor A domain-containing protein 5A-like isoform X1 [Dysidea avara]|uniref:von Willebrand factor A domain-containing protein 5A-like isoform X1 n=1 Tax=Dysidea avara TaxID=196820 RepID=UPI003323186E